MSGLAYHPDFGGPIGYEFERMPEDADGQVAQTIARLRSNARRDAADPLIGELAQRAVRLGEAPGRTRAQQAMYGAWALIKPNIRFRHDEDIAGDLAINDPRKADVVEVIIPPRDQARLIAQGGGVEDCDGFAGFASCLFTRLGIPCSFVTVAGDPAEPNRFTHVYLACYADGTRTALDFSHGPAPGWECPNAGRIKEWPVSGSSFDLASALVPVAVVAAVYLAYSFYIDRASGQRLTSGSVWRDTL